MRVLRYWPTIPIAAAVAVLAYYGYAWTLPKLDPTGSRPADEAFAAMIRGEPIYDMGSWRILFRKDYEAPAENAR